MARRRCLVNVAELSRFVEFLRCRSPPFVFVDGGRTQELQQYVDIGAFS
jgi:hypothetical protein